MICHYSLEELKMNLNTSIGSQIAKLRKEHGFTQEQLAELAGVSQSHLRRVELGEADITVSHLQLLCDAMGITLREFFDDESSVDEIDLAVSKLSPKQKKLLLAFLDSL